MLADRVRMGVYGEKGMPISELPIGSLLMNEDIKYNNVPITWIVVGKNHYRTQSAGMVDRNTNNHITIMSYRYMGQARFGSRSDGGAWRNSELKTTLNGSLYNGFPPQFQEKILDTTLYMYYRGGNSYTITNKIFVPSLKEVGHSYKVSDGINWGFFKTGDDMTLGQRGSYWSRTPDVVSDTSAMYITANNFNNGTATGNRGVAPVLNLAGDALVSPAPTDGIYNILI